MRTFEVKIKKNRKAKECGLTWPDWWNEVYQKVDVVAYEDHPEALGHKTEGCVCVTNEETWALIAAKNDPAVTLLTETTANEKGRAWRPQVTRVTDQEKMLLLVAKVARDGKLTADEKAALDPDDPSLGIGKSRLFDVAKIAEDRGDALSETSL